MNRSLSDGNCGPDAPPWEPLGRFGGHGGYFDPANARRAIASESSYGRRSPGALGEAKSGLTRRGVIYEYVRRHPGGHVRAMARELRLATGDLHYHLFWLEKHGFVKTRKSGFYRFVFPTMVFREEQEVLLGVLSQETPREILLYLLVRAMTQGELARCLRHSQPTVSWHMDRLVQLGMVTRTRTGTGVLYEVAADRDDVLAFVKSYHPEAWRTWADRLGHLEARDSMGRTGEGASPGEAGPTPPAVVELVGKR